MQAYLECRPRGPSIRVFLAVMGSGTQTGDVSENTNAATALAAPEPGKGATSGTTYNMRLRPEGRRANTSPLPATMKPDPSGDAPSRAGRTEQG